LGWPQSPTLCTLSLPLHGMTANSFVCMQGTTKWVIINLVWDSYKHFVEYFLNHKTELNITPTDRIDLFNEIILTKILTFRYKKINTREVI